MEPAGSTPKGLVSTMATAPLLVPFIGLQIKKHFQNLNEM